MDISAGEYTNFHGNVPASEPVINEFKIDWQQQVREDSINAIQNSEISTDQVEDVPDDEGSNYKNDKLEQEIMGLKQLITMLDKMKGCPVFDDDSQDMLSMITKRIENLRLKNWKQSSIKAYFNKSLEIYLCQFFVKEYFYVYKYLVSHLKILRAELTS